MLPVPIPAMATPTKAIVVLLLSTIVTSIGNALLKLASRDLTLSNPFNIPLFIGVILYGFAAILFILALRGGELSVLYPLYGLNFVWVNLIAMTFFNEPMPPLKWLGIGSIILGLVFIGRSSRQPAGVAVK